MVIRDCSLLVWQTRIVNVIVMLKFIGVVWFIGVVFVTLYTANGLLVL
jgi:hypothetical protein